MECSLTDVSICIGRTAIQSRNRNCRLVSCRGPRHAGAVKILVTAGPTREPIDPVRFLSNRSSGRMGYAIAAAFAKACHHVLLVSGPTTIDVPDGVDFLPVESAAEMFAAVAHHLSACQIAVFAAAVADYTPAHPANEKIKKSPGEITLTLTPTRDILGSARDPLGFTGTLVGFAAETSNVVANAREKLVRKQCDLVVANDVSRADIGFDSHDNEVVLVWPEADEPVPRASKHDIATHIVEMVLARHPPPHQPPAAHPDATFS